ncbi:hypothetical protein V3C99_016880 [Haemonchus contortus]
MGTFPNLAAPKRLDFIFTKRRIAKLFVYTIQNSFCFDLSFISERFPLLSLQCVKSKDSFPSMPLYYICML